MKITYMSTRTFQHLNNLKEPALIGPFCNMDWSIVFPQAKVTILPKLNSDHAPVHISMSGTAKMQSQSKFRFQAAWITHPVFKKVVQKVWNSNLNLSENSRKVADGLMQWNQDHFGHIEKRKKRIWARLEGIQ